MQFKEIEHVFFDLDHTLWDFDLNSKLSYKQIFDELDIQLDLDYFISIYEPLNLEFWRRFRESEITKEELRFQRLKTAFDACNYPTTVAQINHLADLYIAYLPGYNHLFDGCVALLDALKPVYKLHLITNGFEEVQHKKVAGSGLTDYFDIVLTGEAAGHKKPDPAIFHKAFELTGATPQNSIMIGDSYAADIMGAHSVGMSTIWFYTTKEPIPDGQVYVRNLAEIHSLLGV